MSQVGDRVVALPEYQAWAEAVNVPSKYVYRLPDGMSFQDASAVAINYSVAHMLLFDVGNLQPGKTVLVHSAGGGVVSSPDFYWISTGFDCFKTAGRLITVITWFDCRVKRSLSWLILLRV